ncbi:DUF3850 domain-containing protein [Vibrio scophthalmi]|uniref:DUF3850 domain-containing protein n=1 Tax=Vibrio scophthalmi TaxID=45658 RepID=UPI003872AFA8
MTEKTASKAHDLKIEPQYLREIISGIKQFEIRKNDRNFQVGDWVRVCDGKYYANLLIKYISDYEQKEGYVVFGFTHVCGGVVVTNDD